MNAPVAQWIEHRSSDLALAVKKGMLGINQARTGDTYTRDYLAKGVRDDKIYSIQACSNSGFSGLL